MIGAPRIGIELGERTARAVRLSRGGWRRETLQAVELEWDRGNPHDLMTALQAHFGESGGRIAITLDFPLLFIKQVKLPPLPAAEKRRILALEPERFFATRGHELLIAARSDDNLVFATQEESVAACLVALEELAPVELVEHLPATITRVLARAGVRDAAVLRDEGKEGVGLVIVRGSRLERARRVFGGLGAAAVALRDDSAFSGRVFLTPWSDDGARSVSAALAGVVPEPLPAVAAVDAPFLPALGAALGLDRLEAGTAADSSLAPAEFTTRIARRRRRARGIAIAACAAAVLFALSSADAWRARALSRLEHDLPALRERAAAALALQTEIQSLEQEGQTIAAIARERPDPLRALAGLTRALPAGAYVRALRFAGNDWQIDGYAPNAARVLAELGSNSEFGDVHFLGATTRLTLGSRTYETFALAFRYAPAP